MDSSFRWIWTGTTNHRNIKKKSNNQYKILVNFFCLQDMKSRKNYNLADTFMPQIVYERNKIL
jgi:hypothetical protein